MYAFYKQLHAPTGVEQSAYCNFFSTTENNLVVAGVNVLNVYRLNHNAESSTKTGDKQDAKIKRQKLELLGTFHLFGNVVSMKAVRLAGATRDSLLLSFKDAKLSLIEYDPGTHDIKTSSMHYFEEEDLRDGFLQQRHHLPLVRTDPENRCSAMLVYGTKLVILPFRKDSVADETENFVTGSKSQVMSSYIINLGKMDEKITNIVDYQFLHGYYEPTLFILYEPLPTWTGRVAVRKDSCSIVAISLNLQEKVHPIIWSLAGLPYDSNSTYPVPRPIGGVLIFAVNSLLYLNQSVPPYGVALNGLTEFSTDFLLKEQEGVKMTLDCAQACFIAQDKMVISLKGGELYVLTLMVDGMRAVRSFNFDKAAASVLTTCMCTCDEGFIFLGSRLGNSILLKYTEKASNDLTLSSVKKDQDEPPQKKKKSDTMGEWMASDVSQLDDDELEVYGESRTDVLGLSNITSYTFEVCDSILNIGPSSQAVMGEPAFLSDEFNNIVDPDLELVTTSGFSKNGALSVLQRSIRPQVVTTFELPGCVNMWTVIGNPIDEKKEEKEEGEEEDNEAKEPLENSHSLLILSREDSSMILKTGEEIMELDHSGFSTQGPTVHAGNMGNNQYVVQVSANSIRLLEGVNQLQHIPIDIGSPIVVASIADPYLVIMSEEGQVMLLVLKDDAYGTGVRLTVSRPQISMQSKILTLCAYKDVSGLFTTSVGDNEMTEPVKVEEKPTLMETSSVLDKSAVDDEDELLYGDSDQKESIPTPSMDMSKTEEDADNDAEFSPSYWVCLVRQSGAMEICSLPDFKQRFLVNHFPMGHKVLVDRGQTKEKGKDPKEQKISAGASTSATGLSGQEEIPPLNEMPTVKELLIVGLGNRQSRPHLLARVEEELLVYEAFIFIPPGTDERLKLRFRKFPHGLILREKKVMKGRKKDETAADKKPEGRVNQLRPFNDISGYAGVFICGPYPHWLFMSSRGALRIHPMSLDGWVTCFAEFHNINCPRGFLYFNKQGELRISVLPTHLSYDAPWPIRKVALRCTPHFVVYHPESKTYSVVTSTAEPCSKLVKVIGEGEREFETTEREERFIWPTVEKFSIQLFSPVSWEAIPNTKIEMDEFEHVTSCKTVYLKSEGTVSGLKPYVAMVTNCCFGEDVTSRGRLIIFDVIEVVPEPGQPLTKNKMKIEYDKEQKGPVSAVDHVQGFLVTAIGQKIYIWQLKNQDLSGVAFIDTQIYICTMTTVKNLILVGDILKSVSLLRYQEDMKVLSLVSRDLKVLEIYSLAFMIDNTAVTFLASDKDKNIIMFAYQPELRESLGGMKLLRRADINVGSHINCFFRIRSKLTDPSTEKRATGIIEKRHINYFVTLDGSLGFIMPISEKVYRRLLMLQNALTVHLPHIGGLNPRAYRLLHTESRTLSNAQRNILDGDLLWKYLHLSIIEKNELGKRLGITVDQIYEDLMDIDRITAHF